MWLLIELAKRTHELAQTPNQARGSERQGTGQTLKIRVGRDPYKLPLDSYQET